MRVREKNTGEVFDLVLVEDLPDYESFPRNTEDDRAPDDVLVPVTSPSGDEVTVSLSPGAALIVSEGGTRTAVSNSHADQYDWLED